MKFRMEKLIAMKSEEEKVKQEIGQYKARLSRGLLLNSNKTSRLKYIIELYLKDKCTYLEKRR